MSALVLLSGGLDSATCLAMASRTHADVMAMCVDYGQRHAVELKAAERQAKDFGATLVRVMLPTILKGSALVGDGEPRKDGIGPFNTYVPARNTQFLAIALSIAEQEKVGHVYIGVNTIDYSGYPDCRPAFIEAMQRVFSLGTAMTPPPELHAPLLQLSKGEIIRLGDALGVCFENTLSCYDPPSSEDLIACGRCDSCMIRKAGFAAAKIPDPTTYAQQP